MKQVSLDSHQLYIYLHEILSQSYMAKSATSSLDKITALRNDIADCTDMRLRQAMMKEVPSLNYDTFRNIHSFLTHLSNISRLLWPPAIISNTKCYCEKPKANGKVCGICFARARSEALLNALAIVDPDHVVKSRTIRDHLEHFDERIDFWVQNSLDGNYVQDMIGPKNAVQGISDGDRMRQYDPTTTDLLFRGEAYSLMVLYNGLIDITQRVECALSKIDRDR